MGRRIRYAIETLLVNALVLSTLYQFAVYLANRRFWRQTPPPPAENAPSTTVIVPLRDKTLDTLALLHVMAITRPTDRYELLMVLESESDPAYPVAREVADSYPDIARVLISGPPAGRVPHLHRINAGWQAAQGDLIAIVEPEAQLTAELWNAALAALADPAVDAAFAPPLVLQPERRSNLPVATGGEMLMALHINHGRTATVPVAAASQRVEGLADGFMILRRRVLEEAGGLLHLLDDASAGQALGRVLRENGQRVAVIPAPVWLVPSRTSISEATEQILDMLTISRAYHLRATLAWPFTNPLTVGFALGLITEREGRWWGRQTWYAFAWLRLVLAYQLDRLRFGRAFHPGAYAQLLMLDTFIAPLLWARALVRRTITCEGRTFRILPGGKTRPANASAAGWSPDETR